MIFISEIYLISVPVTVKALYFADFEFVTLSQYTAGVEILFFAYLPFGQVPQQISLPELKPTCPKVYVKFSNL